MLGKWTHNESVFGQWTDGWLISTSSITKFSVSTTPAPPRTSPVQQPPTTCPSCPRSSSPVPPAFCLNFFAKFPQLQICHPLPLQGIHPTTMLAQCYAKRPQGHHHVLPRKHPQLFTSIVLLLLAYFNIIGIRSDQGNGQQQSASSPSTSSSSFVLADPNNDASAFSPPAEPSPILPATPQQQQADAAAQLGMPPGDAAAPSTANDFQQQQTAPQLLDQNQSAATKAGTGGYGTMVPSGGQQQSDAEAMNESPPSQASAAFFVASPPTPTAQFHFIPWLGPSSSSSEPNMAKGRQFNQYALPGAALPEPMGGIGLGAGPAAGTCPGGVSLNIECDPKRPWPQCPPQSYCYATNTVDIGPYFCCPVWSTYGAAWRPSTPFYAYAPPPPPNWPEPMRMAAAPWTGGPVRKERREQRFSNEEEPPAALMTPADGGAPAAMVALPAAMVAPPAAMMAPPAAMMAPPAAIMAPADGEAPAALMTPDEQRKIVQVMNDWVERQKVAAVPSPPATTVGKGEAAAENKNAATTTNDAGRAA
uniref:Uncharacterized protein n=1 Tax=Globodera rostochiensis TaxID=31243 RepID=A0A914H105_GLORO